MINGSVRIVGSLGSGAVRKEVMRRITDHLKACEEGGIIVLDEIQKFAPGAIELFVSGELYLQYCFMACVMIFNHHL